MIAVYAIGQVKAGQETNFQALAQQFIQESRTHQGCISYDCGEVAGSDHKYCFIERWQNQADLDAHLASPFFQEHAPTLVAMLENGLEINVVNLFA